MELAAQHIIDEAESQALLNLTITQQMFYINVMIYTSVPDDDDNPPNKNNFPNDAAKPCP
jgi:hypothetical protein